jgi:hypothetical protein
MGEFFPFNSLEVILGGGGQTKFVTDKIFKDLSTIPPNGTMGFITNDQIKIIGFENPFVSILDHEGLDGRNDNMCFRPFVLILLPNHTGIIGFEDLIEGLVGLFLKFNSVHQKQDPVGVARSKKQLNDCGRHAGLPCSRGHFKKESVVTILDTPLNGLHRLKLIGSQENQLVLTDEVLSGG